MKRLIAVISVSIFLLAPMAVLSAPVKETSQPVISVIPKSEFNVVLGTNEKVVWMADQVTCDSDIAYITCTADQQQVPSPPQPLGTNLYYRSYTYYIKFPTGETMGWLEAAGWFCFKDEKLQWIDPRCSSRILFPWNERYSFGYLDEWVDGLGSSTGFIQIDGFIDKLSDGSAVAFVYSYIFCYNDGLANGDGKVDWWDDWGYIQSGGQQSITTTTATSTASTTTGQSIPQSILQSPSLPSQPIATQQSATTSTGTSISAATRQTSTIK